MNGASRALASRWRRLRREVPARLRLKAPAFPRWARVVVVLAGLGAVELRTSWLQSKILAGAVRRVTYTVEAGRSPSIRFPAGGPYDRRLGYAMQPEFVERLGGSGFDVEAQARWSPLAARLADAGFFPVYPVKTRAGFSALDRLGRPLWSARYPQRTYRSFDEIPPLVVQSLLFIENRELLQAASPYHNPAVEYDRFVRALIDVGLRSINPKHPVSGGSTIATQLEKVRHSPEGRTESIAEKGRQIVSASLRAYIDGESTLQSRTRLVTDYLNSIPLGAIPGHGEIHGLGDGLWAWHGTDLVPVNALLTDWGLRSDSRSRARRARAYRQVLSLLVAVKKPSAYLRRDHAALDARIDEYLNALASALVIPSWLREEALRVRVPPRERVSRGAVPQSFAERKAFDGVRAELASRLGLQSLYDLDRLDLSVRTTLDGAVNDHVTQLLRQLGGRDHAAQAGLMTHRLLADDDPGRVVYGVTVYERGPNGNELRVQADNLTQPLNVNQGTRLELGSTAKLRTLATYLEAVETLHGQYAGMTLEALQATRPAGGDRLTLWAIDHLVQTHDRGLTPMIEAAMNRRYSASQAESFFTGGGLHRFQNFDAGDNGQFPTVRDAFHRSVNLVFIRLMRDLVHHFMFGVRDAAPVLADSRHPDRRGYLTRFADREGREFLRRFYRRHRGVPADEALETLVARRPSSDARLAVLFRSTRPGAGPEKFGSFMQAHRAGAALRPADLVALYDQVRPGPLDVERSGLHRIRPSPRALASRVSARESVGGAARCARRRRPGTSGGVSMAVQEREHPGTEQAHPRGARDRGIPRHSCVLAAPRLSLRVPGALVCDRPRQLRRQPGGARAAARHHPERRRSSSLVTDYGDPVRGAHPVRDAPRSTCGYGHPRHVSGGRLAVAARAHRGGRAGHGTTGGWRHPAR